MGRGHAFVATHFVALSLDWREQQFLKKVNTEVDIDKDICYDICLRMSNAFVNNEGGEI